MGLTLVWNLRPEDTVCTPQDWQSYFFVALFDLECLPFFNRTLRADVITNALWCNQDDVTCQSVFTYCSKEVSCLAGILNLWMKAFYRVFLITYECINSRVYAYSVRFLRTSFIHSFSHPHRRKCLLPLWEGIVIPHSGVARGRVWGGSNPLHWESFAFVLLSNWTKTMVNN